MGERRGQIAKASDVAIKFVESMLAPSMPGQIITFEDGYCMYLPQQPIGSPEPNDYRYVEDNKYTNDKIWCKNNPAADLGDQREHPPKPYQSPIYERRPHQEWRHNHLGHYGKKTVWENEVVGYETKYDNDYWRDNDRYYFPGRYVQNGNNKRYIAHIYSPLDASGQSNLTKQQLLDIFGVTRGTKITAEGINIAISKLASNMFQAVRIDIDEYGQTAWTNNGGIPDKGWMVKRNWWYYHLVSAKKYETATTCHSKVRRGWARAWAPIVEVMNKYKGSHITFDQIIAAANVVFDNYRRNKSCDQRVAIYSCHHNCHEKCHCHHHW